MKKWIGWLGIVLFPLNSTQAVSDFLASESKGDQSNASTGSQNEAPQKTGVQSVSQENPGVQSSPGTPESKFEKGGALSNGSQMCGNPKAAAAVHDLATGNAGEMAAGVSDKAKGTLGNAASAAGGALNKAKGMAAGALGGLAAAGAAMAALAAIKKGFCQVGCSAKACANSARIHTICVSRCPSESIVNCEAARAAKDGF